MVVEVDIGKEGFLQLESLMAEFPLAIQALVKGPGCFAAADIIQENVYKIVPVRTGALRDSIQRIYVAERINGKRIPRAAARVRMGNDIAFYAHFIELGTVNQPAQMPLRKGLAMRINEQHDAFIRAASTAFERTAKQLASGNLTRAQTRALT